jgi:hypothetical protein
VARLSRGLMHRGSVTLFPAGYWRETDIAGMSLRRRSCGSDRGIAAELMTDRMIIRNRRKIEAVVHKRQPRSRRTVAERSRMGTTGARSTAVPDVLLGTTRQPRICAPLYAPEESGLLPCWSGRGPP